MEKLLTIKDQKIESRRYLLRAVGASAFILIFTIAILVRLLYLQVDQHRFYTTLSKQNILNMIPIQPNRGLIYDRNGILLAKDIPVYSLDIIPARVKNLNATIAKLKEIIPISTRDVDIFERNLYEYRRYQPVPLKVHLSEMQVARFYVNQYRFPGVSIQTRMIRYYPLGKVTSNVIGYVGRISPRELQKVNAENYSASTDIGKMGIEKYYEKILHGRVGAEEAEINANGRIVRILKRIPPIPGRTLYLTIDSKLQAFAEQVLGNNSGAIIVMQPATGQVLAMVSKPSYNPNLFVTGMSEAQYQKLINNPENPLYNRDIRGLYSPGSTIKPFYALYALDHKIINTSYKIFDPGWFRLPNTSHIYHNWLRTGNGWVDVSKAIMVSCDTFFYNLSVIMGISRVDQALHEFHFGQKTDIDLPNELSGILPTPRWKMGIMGKPWYTGDTVNMGIGQGYLSITPMQLASGISTIAMRGLRFRPNLLLKEITPAGRVIQHQSIAEKPVVLKHPKVWNTVIQAMENVVRSPYGTAVGFGRDPPYTVAAKTGTAQVFGTYRDEEDDDEQLNLPKSLRDDHLFIMFAPVKNPKIAMAVVVEHASFADLIARKITDFYFNEELKLSDGGVGAK